MIYSLFNLDVHGGSLQATVVCSKPSRRSKAAAPRRRTGRKRAIARVMDTRQLSLLPLFDALLADADQDARQGTLAHVEGRADPYEDAIDLPATKATTRLPLSARSCERCPSRRGLYLSGASYLAMKAIDFAWENRGDSAANDNNRTASLQVTTRTPSGGVMPGVCWSMDGGPAA